MNPIRANSVVISALVVILLFVSTRSDAVQLQEGVDASIQLRTRYDRNDGRDGDIDNVPVELIENRARLSLELNYFPQVRAYFQLQDVRVWGEETSTLFDFSAQGLDIHQAYGDIRLKDKQLIVRLGRQEIILDGQRLVGAVGWTAQGRSFDAIRLMLRPTNKLLKFDLFGSVLSDQDNLFAKSEANQNQSDAYLAGLHAAYTILKTKKALQTISFTMLYEHTLSSLSDMDRYTLGVYNRGKHGLLFYRLEGYYQGGDLGLGDISAFLLGCKAGVTLPAWAGLKALVWFDYVSGDGDPNDTTHKTFQVPFGTNHKFYGMADFFLNMGAHTNGQGLMDLAGKLSLKPLSSVSLAFHYHRFLTAQDRGGPADIGDEIDLVVTYKPFSHLKLGFELFVMFPGEWLEQQKGGSDPDVGIYITSQIDL